MNPRASLVLALLLAACAGQDATPPPPDPDIDLLATASTSGLVRNAVAAYAKENGLEYRLTQVSNAELAERVAATPGQVGFSIHPPDGNSLWSTPIAWDGIAVIVHPSIAIRALSREDLRGIYLGRINAWEEIPDSGASGAIHLVVREEGSDVRAAFETGGLDGLTPTLNSLVAPGPGAMLEAVAEDPGAIGHALQSQLDESVRAVAVDGVSPTLASIENGDYPFAVPVLAISQAEPNGPVRDFLLWLQSSAGQTLVAQTHGRVSR